MASSRRPETEAQSGSSSEEEGSSEENEDQEVSESEEDNAPTPTRQKRPAPKKLATSTKPQPSSSDDSGSDSDLDSTPNATRRPDPTLKPIASKPMEEPPKATKKPRSKPGSVTPAAEKPGAAARRAAERGSKMNRESKRAKKEAEETDNMAKKTGDNAKKQLFQRLWSEDDEIVILNGMAKYAAEKGADPVADMNGYHDFIKKSLHVDVSKTQLSDKVRRLRKKYENRTGKGKNGEDPSFSKPHEQKAYELSKKIWGNEANGVGVDSPNSKVNGKSRKNQSQKTTMASPKMDGLEVLDKAKEGEKMDVESNLGSVGFNRSIVGLGLEEEIIKDGLEMIRGAKKFELKVKWEQLRVEEVELYLKRLDLIREQAMLVLEALKSSGH
ncbi:probable transcription factor At1g11510 [Actinidia eriantha]|uniref:probable transcription factor At1g11510 n=1 Tax=Actinidia eriantha TaxID=165200 RepID=UPI0025888C0C|nr:probable transcription factor At1g11510 [Actinidia eriantha]